MRQRHGLARGHTQLPFDQINAGNCLCHRVFDLQARIHFHEPEPVFAQPARPVDDEFHRARAGIADGLGRLHRRLPHCGAHGLGHPRGGGFLDHLLVAALQRAITLMQVNRFAVIVAKHLNFNVAGVEDVFLDQHGGIAKTGLALARGSGKVFGKIGGVIDAPHPLATAARAGFDEDRIADFGGAFGQKCRVLVGTMIARHNRHARLLHQRLGGILQAHRADGTGAGADKGQARSSYFIRKIGVFRQKAIARMDGLRAGLQRRLNDDIAQQIAFAYRCCADAHCLIGQSHMAGIGIGVGIDGDRGHAHFTSGVDDPAGDFATVGDEDFREHHSISKTRKARCSCARVGG